MLFDPKWQKPKTRVPSLAGFKQWVRAQDPAERYFWPNPNECPAGLYFDYCGVPVGLHEVWRAYAGVYLQLSILSAPPAHGWGTFGDLQEKLEHV